MMTLFHSDPVGLSFIFLGLFLGAILKGATGAGLPIIAIPTIAAIYDVRVAVMLLVIPNFVTNVWQIAKYKEHNLSNTLARDFTLAGIAGAGVGTLLLAYLPLLLLNVFIAIVVFAYIALRLIRPEFRLAVHVMQKWRFIAGSSAGVLQGAVGLSSPITITFLHSGRLPRLTFIYIASMFFAGMSLIQLPLLSALGLMTWEMIILSVLALIPIMIGLPLGARMGQKISPVTFDRTIIVLLTTLAIKMLVDAILTLQSVN